MRSLLLLLIICIVACGAYTIWPTDRASTPAPENAKAAEPGAPMAVAPATELVPDALFHVTQEFSASTDSGVVRIGAGTRVTVIEDAGGVLRVSDGTREFDIPRGLLTNDPGFAAKAVARQDGQQESSGKKAAAAPAGMDGMDGMLESERNLAIKHLQARENALRQEEARVREAIAKSGDAGRVRAYYYVRQGVSREVVGGVPANDELQKQLATVESELGSISGRIRELQL
jgi:hypothetical protein